MPSNLHPALARWMVAITGAIGIASAGGAAQFTSVNGHGAILEGNWQSCRDANGEYGERIYDGRIPGMGPFELHMGPYHEFALFRGVQDEHRSHASSENLLQPFTVSMTGTVAKHHWQVVGVRLDVTLAGGSRDDCESWFVTLKPIDSGS